MMGNRSVSFYSEENKFSDSSQQSLSLSETSSSIDSGQSLLDNVIIYDDYFKNIAHSWTPLGNAFIPCVILEDIEYCPAKLLEEVVFKDQLMQFSPKLYKKILPSFFLTQYEVDVINNIISRADCGYTGEKLKYNDYFVKLQDAKDLYEFLLLCHNLLNSDEVGDPIKCGFLRINKMAVVPYILRDEEQLVPLTYFEGNIKKFEDEAVILTTAEWIYIKMCFLIQGTREELLDKNMKFIPIATLKKGAKSSMVYDKFWPGTSDQFKPLSFKSSENFTPLMWIESPVYDFNTVNNKPAIEPNYSKCNLLQYNEELSQLEYCSNFLSGQSSIDSFSLVDLNLKNFYWGRVVDVFLPIILKRDEKLCAAQYVEDFIFKDILQSLNPMVYENAIPSTMTTETDTEILNNMIGLHYKEYEKNAIKPGDSLVNLAHIKMFNEFIIYCNKLLSSKITNNLEKYGFVRINRKPLVPFIKREGKHFVPFMYFEGNLENYVEMCVTATRKEWWYMKICFVIQGTRAEVIDTERKIIELDLMKNSFGKTFKIDEFWPKQKSILTKISAKRRNKYVPLKWCELPDHFY
ncbi:uncharacterized protein LOC119662318 [Teleopsis dalmanni]|uniref:uncharacterized protein LOC119662318 n=1 Tax=Teleopsis dalmanni TaxID=139649 RepID=UPI0018CE237A|nr:uncharacterized protein LOC119662318 [Teleopsis dalmanni]